ncbi:hypothetical protein BDZ91DRAFT_799590 [Kalaharituber pfeilii]|nr:hypothetical protein BDZ91DRAFT_799590 [Kalaharituber pfeilii]
MTLNTTKASLPAPLVTPNLLPDIQGRHSFVQTAYNLESAQPAYLAAHQVREFQHTVQELQNRWKTPSFPTTILPSPEPSFRTQFRTASGTPTSRNPKRINSARGPTGAEVAEAELAKRRAIQERDNIADNHTQDIIVLHSRKKVAEALELAEEIPDLASLIPASVQSESDWTETFRTPITSDKTKSRKRKGKTPPLQDQYAFKRHLSDEEAKKIASTPPVAQADSTPATTNPTPKPPAPAPEPSPRPGAHTHDPKPDPMPRPAPTTPLRNTALSSTE